MNQGRSHRSERGGIFVNLIVFIFVVVFCGVLYLFRHPVMRFVAESWAVEDPLDRADALIVLSDDNFYADRATRAAELFREGKAPVVVASGRRLRPMAGIAELMEHDLIERGVPKDKIIRLQHDGDSTSEEAEADAKFVAARKWKSVIVVTSNYHTRRARYIFRKIFPEQVDVRVASARDADFDPAQWWEKRKSIKLLTREFAAMLVAVWELRGKYEPPQSPQSVVDLVALKPLALVSQYWKHPTFATPHTCLHTLSAVLSSLF
jgi:uncharacterized SAM-binding protein YcdF (DUF218 family)